MIKRKKPLSRVPKRKPERRVGKVSGTVRLSGKAMTALRDSVYARDRGRCQWEGCGILLPKEGSIWVRAHLAHKLGHGAGGGDTPENTRILCFHHHIGAQHMKGLKG